MPCDVPRFAALPHVPGLQGIDEWVMGAIRLYEDAAIKAGATNRCLRELREKGVIR